MLYPNSLPKLLIYDLDGTLIDSIGIVSKILNELRADLGKETLGRADLLPWISLGGVELIANSLGVDEKDARRYLAVFREQYFLRPTPLESVFEGVVDTLEYLINEGYDLAICTNKPRKLTEKVLMETGLERYFACLVAGGDMPTSKPDVRNLNFCLEYFDVDASDAILLGDSVVDQTMAHAAGVPFMFFQGGYDDGVDRELIQLSIDQHIQLVEYLELKKGSQK